MGKAYAAFLYSLLALMPGTCQEGMRAMLGIVVFCIGLMIALPVAWADAWEDCLQMQDSDRQIHGCTEIINEGHETKNNLAFAYVFRGMAYNLKGDYDWAIADLDKAIELDPKNAIAYDARGSAYGYNGDYDRAIFDLDKAIELNPNFANTYRNRGNAYEHKGDHDRAIADYRKALELDPNLAPAKEGLKRLGASP
jgi:tetratricopeptide (TPR) repeat protein